MNHIGRMILFFISLVLIACSNNEGEEIYPIEDHGGYWCQYEITKTNSPRLAAGSIICLSCDSDQIECAEVKQFLQGAIWYEVKLKSINCENCEANDFFEYVDD